MNIHKKWINQMISIIENYKSNNYKFKRKIILYN